jgi:hypothetical protein
MDAKVIASIIALVGVAIAALLSASGYLYRVRADRKKTSKHVLYYLLEIRHALKTNLFDGNKAAQDYLSCCRVHLKSKGIKDNDSSIYSKLTKLIGTHFNSIAAECRSKMGEDFIKPFESALIELSKDKPVLAHTLKGKEQLHNLISLNDSYCASIKDIENFPSSGIADEILPNELSKAQFDAVETLIKDIDADILEVSKNCDRTTYKQCQKILSQKLEKDVNFTELGLEKFLDSILEKFVEAIEEQQKQSTPQSNT